MILYTIAAAALVAGFIIGLVMAWFSFYQRLVKLNAENIRVVKTAAAWNRRWEKLNNQWWEATRKLQDIRIPVRERGRITGYETVMARVQRELKDAGYDV